MGIHWGVDSWHRATDFVPGTKQPFWDFVCATYGRQPEFWCRYINGERRPVLTNAEALFLLNNDCRVLPILVPNRERMKVTGAEGFANGQRSGQTTIDIASDAKLNIPEDIFIYANIEWDDQPSADWMAGWTRKLLQSKYGGIGGFYCSPTNQSFSTAYRELLRRCPEPRAFRRLWSVTPFRGCTSVPQAFSADSPECDPGVTAVWQYAIKCNGGLLDLNVANDEGFARMWHR
jgi:hypothetical protein